MSSSVPAFNSNQTTQTNKNSSKSSPHSNTQIDALIRAFQVLDKGGHDLLKIPKGFDIHNPAHLKVLQTNLNTIDYGSLGESLTSSFGADHAANLLQSIKDNCDSMLGYLNNCDSINSLGIDSLESLTTCIESLTGVFESISQIPAAVSDGVSHSIESSSHSLGGSSEGSGQSSEGSGESSEGSSNSSVGSLGSSA